MITKTKINIRRSRRNRRGGTNDEKDLTIENLTNDLKPGITATSSTLKTEDGAFEIGDVLGVCRFMKLYKNFDEYWSIHENEYSEQSPYLKNVAEGAYLNTKKEKHLCANKDFLTFDEMLNNVNDFVEKKIFKYVISSYAENGLNCRILQIYSSDTKTQARKTFAIYEKSNDKSSPRIFIPFPYELQPLSPASSITMGGIGARRKSRKRSLYRK